MRDAVLTGLVKDLQMTAASFIVTVYGDAVAPRGEVLWMGSLISVCDRVGIRENLVRTAVSRLVVADRLQGQRIGRRSFYRLAPAARAEFAEAARLLYAPGLRPSGWLVVAAQGFPEETRRRFHLAPMGGDLWMCPDWGDLPPQAQLLLRCPGNDPALLPGLARFWDLNALAARYEAVIHRFTPLLHALRAGHRLAPAEALTARLLLVHVYRGALLRDPLLPAEILPERWSGSEAKTVFCEIYQLLSPAAQAGIAETMEDEAGPLPAATPTSEALLAGLA